MLNTIAIILMAAVIGYTAATLIQEDLKVLGAVLVTSWIAFIILISISK